MEASLPQRIVCLAEDGRGKPFKKDRMLKRNNWDNIKAVINDEIHEIDSVIILQPGPAALTDGIGIVGELIRNYLRK